MAEVELDGLGRDEQGGGDRTRGQTASGKFGDTALARGQRLDAAARLPSRPRSGREQLRPRLLHEREGAGAVAEIERLAQRFARVDPAIGPAQRRTVGEGGKD